MYMDKFVPRREFLKIINISRNSLIKLRKENKVEVIKVHNKNLYNINKFLASQGIEQTVTDRKNISYCRVSSLKQKDDLNSAHGFFLQLFRTKLKIEGMAIKKIIAPIIIPITSEGASRLD